jgi:hypothetical protein
MRIVFNVTQADIGAGNPHLGSSCPIARALRRATGIRDLHVTKAEVLPYLPANKALGRNTKKMVRFIDRFDEGLPVRPDRFAVVLDLGTGPDAT